MLGDWSVYTASAAEILIVLAVLAISYKIKSWPVAIFAFAQLGMAIAAEFIHSNPADRSPAFIVDSLSIILVLITSVIGSLIILYALGYMRSHEHHAPPTAASTGMFFFFLVGFLGAMNGLVLANDMKWLSVFWEATTICSFVLIGHDGTTEAKRNAKRALIINMFGGTALMAASLLVLSKHGADSFGSMLTHVNIVAFACIALAACTKSAQMPFQSWLLGAMVAPTPVSALLHSATMVNAGVYIILRAAPAFAGTKIMFFVSLIGAFTFAVTAALAIGQSNGKKVLAYSTISNLGLIITCAGLNTPLAYAAALMLLCFHAASKGLLFLCMGTIEQNIGSRDIEDMGSLMREMPLTTVMTLIGMASMLIPPFGMLLSKWMAIEASINSPVILLLLVVGSALTVLFWAKWIGRITTVSFHDTYKWESVAFAKMITKLGLTLIVLAAGFGAVPVFKAFIQPMATEAYKAVFVPASSWMLLDAAGNILTWPIFACVGIAIVAMAISFRFAKKENVRPPYLCGENLEGVQRTYEFRSFKDQGQTAWCTSIYLRNVFEEGKTTMWANLIASLIVVSIFIISVM
jgi:ech hydrogenase subunit A